MPVEIVITSTDSDKTSVLAYRLIKESQTEPLFTEHSNQCLKLYWRLKYHDGLVQNWRDLGAVSKLRWCLSCTGIHIIKVRWSWDHLIFIMGILYLERQSLYWNSPYHWCLRSSFTYHMNPSRNYQIANQHTTEAETNKIKLTGVFPHIPCCPSSMIINNKNNCCGGGLLHC